MCAAHPDVVAEFGEADQRQVAHAARNNATAAVVLMLECGWPVDARGQHRATPLHWAAFHGNCRMARVLLGHAPPLDAADADFHGTPLDWAIYGSERSWHAASGEYPATVRVLLEAGARAPGSVAGTPAVADVLREFGATGPV
jgi:ankyrin repeat protein